METFVEYAGTVLRLGGLALSPLLLLPLVVLVVPGLAGPLARALVKLIDRVSGGAMAISIAFAFAIIIIQLAAVMLRYVFGVSFSWLNDSILFSFAAIFMLGAAATLRDDGHVRVDILRPRFSARGRAAIELVGAMVFIFPIGALVLYAGASSLARSWAGLEPFNESDGLPIKYIFKSMVPVFAVLMLAQGLAEALKAALGLRGLMPLPSGERRHEGQS